MLLKFNHTKTLLAVSIAATVCLAQNVNISGTVTDTGGVAIEGAAVLLEKGGLVDTTGADGSFTLTGTTGINAQINGAKLHTISATINNGFMHLNIAEKSAVEINTYTLQGKVVSSVKKTLGVGAHSMKLPNLGGGVYMYQIKIGSEQLLIKNCTLSGGTSASIHGSSSPILAGQPMGYDTINDVIAVTKDGYLNYRVIVTNSDTNSIEIEMIISAGSVTDIDGNVYQTVQIGNQVWTVENLRTTKYNDGSTITKITSNVTWDSCQYTFTPGYCYSNNTTHPDTIKKWGALYNWYVVSPTNPKQIAPAGWHVPDSADWDTLRNYLIANGYNWDGTTSGNKIAKSMAAMTDWPNYTTTGKIGCNLSINNASGFSALPGGSRDSDGNFYHQGIYGLWWSATEINASHAWIHILRYYFEYLDGGDGGNKGSGFSVRLLRDLN